MRWIPPILVIIACFACCNFVDQTEFQLILLCSSIAFAGYFLTLSRLSVFSITEILVIGLVARLMLIPLMPKLSDDIYRFIWDGYLCNIDVNPYSVVPAGLDISESAFLQQIFPSLNSPEYYSVYPPILQYLFQAVVWLAGESVLGAVVLFKSIILFGELLSFSLIVRLLKYTGKATSLVSWYWLNPLIVIELNGNIHFEALMITGIIGGLYGLYRSKLLFSILGWCVAILTKLIPIILLGFSLIRKPTRVSIATISGVGVLLIALSLPFFPDILGIKNSLDLYFRTFEFNASIYYLFRSIGFLLLGYNAIATIGPLLSGLFILWAGYLVYLFYRSRVDFWDGILFLLTGYFLFQYYRAPLVYQHSGFIFTLWPISISNCLEPPGILKLQPLRWGNVP